jgi:hypothetical protein
MEPINDILSSFEELTLKELDVVRLLDRVDTKYVFNIEKLPEVLADLRKGFRVLNLNGIRQSCYETIYYDTDNFSMYHHHHNGKSNRHKVRLRRYCDSDINYLEVKFKSNKGRTIKSRIRKELFTTNIEQELSSFLEKTPSLPADIKPVLWVNYTRMTFANKENTTRLTIDTNLRFSTGEKEKNFNSLVIAEIKQSRATQSSFHTLMQNHRIPSISVSKYCLGMAILYEGIKKNNFKRKILTINKVTGYGS